MYANKSEQIPILNIWLAIHKTEKPEICLFLVRQIY